MFLFPGHLLNLSPQFEWRHDGILARQGYVGLAGEASVSVQSRSGKLEFISLRLLETVRARAVTLVRLLDRLPLQQQGHDDFETVLLRGQDERSDLFRELIVIVELVLIEEGLALLLQIAADLLVLGVFDDDLGDLLVSKVDRRQQRLIDATSVDEIQKEANRLRNEM